MCMARTSGFLLVKKVLGALESGEQALKTLKTLINPWRVRRGVTRMAKTSGCALSGFVLVKKVPGALHFLAKSPGHSFDYRAMNMSHVVNYLYFGNRPSPRRAQARNPVETLSAAANVHLVLAHEGVLLFLLLTML